MTVLDCGDRLSGFGALERGYASLPDAGDVIFDLRALAFVEPVGVAKLFLFATSLRRSGRGIGFDWPAPEIVTFLRRCGMLRMFARADFDVPGEMGVPNEGRAPSLLEWTHIRTDEDGLRNAGRIDTTAFRRVLERQGIESRAGSLAWMEIASNAAEHSKASDNGAFFSAQAWHAQRRELQIVVVDDGCGIPATLQGLGYADDCAAVRAAIERTDVTGRRDAAGNPMGGGLGLPYVADSSTKMMVRSGSCLATGYRGAAGNRLVTTGVRPVRGTLVVADVALGIDDFAKGSYALGTKAGSL